MPISVVLFALLKKVENKFLDLSPYPDLHKRQPSKFCGKSVYSFNLIILTSQPTNTDMGV